MSRSRILSALVVAGLFLGAGATVAAAADVCLTVDESHDTFSPSDRSAALLLLARQFELGGEHVVPPPCSAPYLVSHVKLGDVIVITLSGPTGQREATAHGMDDVPAVYSQMVRSLLTGRPMGASGIIDRGNVSKAQAEAAPRVYSDSIAYARLGFGALFGDRVYSGPAVGVFGYRREFDSFGIDVSFLNFLYQESRPASGPFYYGDTGGMTGSWVKLGILRFVTPQSARSAYVGTGLSWSSAHLYSGSRSWSGSGLQGEAIAGYEVGRASTIRVFLQTDVGLPFYRVNSVDYFYSTGPPYVTPGGTRQRYAPSLAVSLGLGWQRGGR